MNSPLMYPILVVPIGPSKGMSEIDRAADAPIRERMSIGVSWSIDKGVMITWISLRNPLGNRGRSGLSVSRAMRTP